MKIKNGFAIKEVADSFVVVPTGANLVDFSAMLTLNDTGAFLWNLLVDGATEEELVDSLASEYDVDKQTAAADIAEFVAVLVDKKVVE